jgi:hypothetical protein
MNSIGLFNVSQLFKDDEGHNVILRYAKYTASGGTTSNIIFNTSIVGNNTISFLTHSFGDIGVHKFKLCLNDTQMFTYADLNVEFTNTPPFFIDDAPINLTLKFNNSFEY